MYLYKNIKNYQTRSIIVSFDFLVGTAFKGLLLLLFPLIPAKLLLCKFKTLPIFGY